jgi:nicotinamide phosphoribosyltransferase
MQGCILPLQVWYPTTVATLSRRCRDGIEHSFLQSCDDGIDSPLVQSRLHDFGMRGCTCTEQSIVGGCAHLLSFDGTDTMPAAFYAQYYLNNGKPVGFSIPATVRSQKIWRGYSMEQR